jgi:type IV secretion system protein VirD4
LEVIGALIIQLIGLGVFIGIMYVALKSALITMGLMSKNSLKDTNNENNMNFLNPLKLIIDLVKGFLGFLFGGFSNTGLMGHFEKNSFINSSNKGLLINGDSARISEKNSFNHMAIIAKSGGGKTTTYIIPNIINLSKQNNSMIITDLSGELFEKTSGYLERKGYKIYVLDPENLEESIRYNPLYYATDSAKVDLVCETLITSAYPGEINPNDRMWLNGAKTIISILIKILIRMRDEKYINLGNVKYLLNHFGADGKDLNDLVIKYGNDKIKTEWYGFISGNSKTIQSFISTANMVLNSIGVNDNLEILTASNSFDFERLRREKSVVYIRIPPHLQEQYNFIQNLFYTQFFNNVYDMGYSKKQIPVYCLLDEFGNMSIPNFSSLITTIRKYNVSISIVLQDLSQLERRYGRNEAYSIFNGGINGKIFFSGIDLNISSDLEKMLGRKYVERYDAQGILRTYEEPVMSIRDIRTMKDNEVLFIYANKLPIKLKTTPYYKQMGLNKATKIRPYSPQNREVSSFEYVRI